MAQTPDLRDRMRQLATQRREELRALRRRQDRIRETIGKMQEKLSIYENQEQEIAPLLGDLDSLVEQLGRPPRDLVELETLVARVRWYLDEEPGPTSPRADNAAVAIDVDPEQPLSGLTISPAIQWVLRRVGDEYLHFEEIARRAIANGYRGPRAGDDLATVARSMLDVMRRRSYLYDRKDLWFFRLAPSESIPDEDEEDGDDEGSERRRIAEQMMREAGGPIRTTEIADRVIDLGLPHPERRKYLINAITVAMDRSPKFVKVGPGLWSLVELENSKPSKAGQ